MVLGIKAREECIRQIEDMSARDFGHGSVVTQEKVDAVSYNRYLYCIQVIQEINDLRKLSIHVVETIVMWRDLFRQIGMLGVSQAKSLKRL